MGGSLICWWTQASLCATCALPTHSTGGRKGAVEALADRAGRQLRQPIAPHLNESGRGELLDCPQAFFTSGSVFCQMARLHRARLSPCPRRWRTSIPRRCGRDARRARSALCALLMDQIKVVQRRLLVGLQLEQDRRNSEFVGPRNGVVTTIGDFAITIAVELVFAELVKADIGASALLGIEVGLILATASMKVTSRPNASAARLTSSRGVPFGISFSARDTVSAGASGGGTSE